MRFTANDQHRIHRRLHPDRRRTRNAGDVMGRRSIRKQQIEAAHTLLKNPKFVMQTWGNTHWDDGDITYVIRELSPVDLSPTIEVDMVQPEKSFFYRTDDKKHAEFVLCEKNAEAIVDAIRKIK